MTKLDHGYGERIRPRSTPAQLVALYAHDHSSEILDQILKLWEEDRREFARSIEAAVAEMAQEPGAGIVRSDGRPLDEWLEAFDSHPEIWAELVGEIREITERTGADVDREHYSRIVMAAMKRCNQ